MSGYPFRAGLLAGFLLLLLTAPGCRDATSESPAESQAKLVQVSTIPVEPAPIRDVLLLPGVCEPWEDILVAADTAGTVERIGPKEGDAVERDQMLAEIDVAALKANLDHAQAAYDLSHELYKRRQPLFEKQIITQEEYDRSRTERTLAEAHLRQARIEYERGLVRTPIAGFVNRLFVDPGEFIDRGKPVADIVAIDRLKIDVNVPELDVRYLATGQSALVTVDAFPDRPMAGTLGFIAYKADPATRSFAAEIHIDNPDHRIRPGMIARVALIRRTIPDALTAPLFAVVDRGGERLVYVVEDGVARARTVTIGVIEADRVQILSGLNPGDLLIVKGQTEVEEGTRVERP